MAELAKNLGGKVVKPKPPIKPLKQPPEPPTEPEEYEPKSKGGKILKDALEAQGLGNK